MPTAPESDLDSTPSDVSRRSALRVGGGGALALVIGGVAGWVDRRDPSSASARDRPVTTTTGALLQIPDLGKVDAGIVSLGRRVIETTGESDVATLIAQLPIGEGDPIERAAAHVRDDFLASRTIIVDGWVLAASEARAAAVIALLCEQASC